MSDLIDFSAADTVTLRRLAEVADYGMAKDNRRIGIVVDTETTGFDPNLNEIIEICMIPFEFDQEGRIGAVFPAVTMVGEPRRSEITPEISRVTGITHEDVAGKKIDWNVVAKIFSKAKLVVAHNAKFDRGFILKEIPDLVNIPWVCTYQDVPWSENDVGSAKLDYLAMRFGFFFSAHRAEADCRALLEICSKIMPDDRSVLCHTFSGLAPKIRVLATHSKFESKDLLKARGYRWSASRKTWWTVIGTKDEQIERDWLAEHAYDGHASADFRSLYINGRFDELN